MRIANANDPAAANGSRSAFGPYCGLSLDEKGFESEFSALQLASSRHRGIGLERNRTVAATSITLHDADCDVIRWVCVMRLAQEGDREFDSGWPQLLVYGN